ncbi:MAG TPA: N-formylglutamate amidohydrolase [Alphaproteobacteria bacterium]
MSSPENAAADPPFEIIASDPPATAVVLASPHSGRRYGRAFLSQTRLDEAALRRSEDAHVDALLTHAPARGAALVKALFPRTYVDVNREPLELDPDMFAESLPGCVHATSPRVRSGLGTIARLGANGQPIYRGALSLAEARARLRACYFPYHRALRALVRRAQARFGYAILLDCHSMPSQAVVRPSGLAVRGRGAPRGVDFVLGDCHGGACHAAVADTAQATLERLGHTVIRNAPYSGGFTTRHYGRPASGVHALQIEVNRALYLDEDRLEPTAGLAPLARDLAQLVEALAAALPFARAAE